VQPFEFEGEMDENGSVMKLSDFDDLEAQMSNNVKKIHITTNQIIVILSKLFFDSHKYMHE
jgi:hypothetical protein